MNTLAEYMILSAADNRPPMLDKDLYDSWESRMKLYMQNREHGRMILESVENGPLIWPTVEWNRERTKKYVELSAAEKFKLIEMIQLLSFSNSCSFLKTEDLDTYDSDCDDISNAKAVLMANISNYGSDVISEENVQDTNLQAQQDSMILSMIEQISKQMINHVNNWEKANKEQNNESVTTELERYKERVKSFEQRLNIDLGSREKMIDSQMDDMIKEKLALKKKDIDLKEDFGKRFVPQQELSADEASWYHMLKLSTKSIDALPVKIEAPKELPKVILVNKSLKKLKLHLANFNQVVKIKTTPNAQKEGEWAFEHTKAIFNNEIIPFFKSLKDIFNVFDKDLLSEIMEVQTVFDQMEAVVQQCSVDKQCLEIAKK
uniref:Uncharacterized protein n=1 Tax=Tanacetum cinerariifolium TaxID=118510 RepID=A0A699GRC8_TANCI|nr:hypothetical protein [Tanacetum cinerariifolium]